MKTLLLLILTLSGFGNLFAQSGMQGHFPQVRGHYKQIAVFSPKAKSSTAVDTMRFPYDPVVGERRLSLKPVYLTEVTVDKFQLPNVPDNSSPQTLADIAYLYDLQQKRTPEEVRASLYMANVYYNLRLTPKDTAYARYRKHLFHIGRSIGTWFNPDDLPVTADFVANVWRDANYFIWALKFKYARVRPYVLDKRLKNLEDTNWAAYPSGHAANSYINAFLYAEIAPEFTDVFMKDAYDMAHSREILGVHFPTDSESSRIFAWQFVQKLFANEKFQQDLAQVRKEWTAKAKEKLNGSYQPKP